MLIYTYRDPHMRTHTHIFTHIFTKAVLKPDFLAGRVIIFLVSVYRYPEHMSMCVCVYK